MRCTRDSAEEERHVTTRHLEWRPRGDQSTWLTDPGPHQKDILINKLRPGHEMDIKLFAVKVKFNLTILLYSSFYVVFLIIYFPQ